MRYDCGGFTNESQSSIETDVTKNPQKQAERKREEQGKGRAATRKKKNVYIYIEVGGTKVCIESRNANASNIDTASPFERSLNLSQHSSHPFFYGSTANSNTAMCDSPRAYFPGVLERKDTRARRERVGGVEGPPINRMCGL